jgi:transcriptional regulator with XRE-family HTH domain
MDSVKRAKELAAEREMSLYDLARQCGIPYNTLKNAEKRSSQLSLHVIELICGGLEIPLVRFFEDPPAAGAAPARGREAGAE